MGPICCGRAEDDDGGLAYNVCLRALDYSTHRAMSIFCLSPSTNRFTRPHSPGWGCDWLVSGAEAPCSGAGVACELGWLGSDGRG